MSEKSVHTKTVRKGVAKSNTVKLIKTANTAIHFEPILHEGGVRGRLIKYKKTSAKTWDELKPSNFTAHALGSMEKVVVELSTEATTTLFNELKSRDNIVDQGIPDGSAEYIVAKKSDVLVINDENKRAILKQILEEGLSDEYWDLIAQSQPDLANRLASGHIQHVRAKTVSELKRRLAQDFPETSGPNSWQSWIYENHWLFGVNYQEPLEKQKINLQGVMPDYLFPRIDGFVDLLEIKLPTHKVIALDSSHPGSFRWAAETTKAIGQVVFYLAEIERQQLEIEAHIYNRLNRSVSMLKPRAFILIGNSEDWSSQERAGLRRLNHSLHGIEVLTYRELIHRGEAFLMKPKTKVEHANFDDEIPF